MPIEWIRKGEEYTATIEGVACAGFIQRRVKVGKFYHRLHLNIKNLCIIEDYKKLEDCKAAAEIAYQQWKEENGKAIRTA